jgi:hypothetical protein
MIGTALKNTILFLLIILLLNVLLSNVISDKLKNNLKNDNENNFNENNFNENNFNENNFNENNDLENVKDIEYALPERDIANNKNKMKQIYDFVFDDNADENLDNFYKVENEKDIKKLNTRDINVRCADTITPQKRFCNTTETSKEAIQGHYSNFNKLQCQDNLQKDKHFYLVNKFKDENINNGDDELSGIEAYDNSANCNFDFI